MSTYTKGRSIYHPTTGEISSWSGVDWNQRWTARKCVEGFCLFWLGDIVSQFYVLARFRRAVDAKRDRKRQMEMEMGRKPSAATEKSNLKTSFWRDVVADWNSIRSFRFGVYGMFIYSPMRLWWGRSMDRMFPFSPRDIPNMNPHVAAGASSSKASAFASATSSAATGGKGAATAAGKRGWQKGSAAADQKKAAEAAAAAAPPPRDPTAPIGRSGLLTRQDIPMIQKRLFMEYSVWVPLQINICLFFSSFCDARPLDILPKFSEQFFPLYIQTAMLWLPMQALCFLALPLWMWTPATNMATVAWAFLLAYGNFKAQQVILHGQLLPPARI